MECQKKVSKWLDVKTACRTKTDITDDKIWKGHMKTHVYTIFEGKFQVKRTTHHTGAKCFVTHLRISSKSQTGRF